MQLNDLLRNDGIDPKDVIIFRHCPKHMPNLRKDFLWLAANNHDLFNAYQQTQSRVVENAMLKAKFIASFVGHQPGKAVFVGLYKINDHWPLSYKEFWKQPLNIELRSKYGMIGMEDKHGKTEWFDLVLLPFQSELRSRLVVRWPGKERAWWRWADRNSLSILKKAILPKPRNGNSSSKNSGGGGFGDPVENAIVEAAAIGMVTAAYEKKGWKVCSVERDKCGFDLDCRKESAIENVEVKGVRGTEPSFLITAGEFEQAKKNPKFVLAVVTSALTKSPKLRKYSGEEFCQQFELRPIQYLAALPS